MARKQARVAAMQLIYEQMEGGDGGEETLCGLIGFEPAAAVESPEEAPPEGMKEIPLEGAEPGQEEAAPDPVYEEDLAFIRSIVEGVRSRADELDGRISGFLRDWSLARVAKVDLAILRLAFYELLYLKDVPETVVISEAVEMAKRFSTDKSGAFVNGVLGALSRRETE